MNTATEKLFETLKNAAVTAEQIFDCIKALIYAGVNPSFGESNDKTYAFDYVDDYCEYHPEVKREQLVKLLEENFHSKDTVDDEDIWDILCFLNPLQPCCKQAHA